MPYRSALFSQHEALEGRMAPFAGVLLPQAYKSERREVRSAVGSAAMTDWAFHGLLRVSGPDRTDFLNRLLSNSIPPAGRGCHAFLLNVAGKPVVETWLHALEDELLLEVPRSLARTAVEQFNHYHFTERLQIRDASAEFSPIAVLGPSARKVLEGVAAGDLSGGVGRLKVGRLRGGGSVEAWCSRSGTLAVDTFVLWVPCEEAGRVWERLLHTRNKPAPVGTGAVEVLRVEAGSPRFEADYDDTTLFLEMAPPDSYSETKGCYIGQEVVARVLHRGHVNRRLVGIRADAGKKEIQGKLFADGREVGRVTSSVVSPEFGPIALGYVRRENWHAGTALQAEKGRAVRVHELPFRPSARVSGEAELHALDAAPA
ncbi:MAG: glycine cleavage T C-terminal barrel domain-containing protein [Candidatus Eremiobacterota bacterium]